MDIVPKTNFVHYICFREAGLDVVLRMPFMIWASNGGGRVVGKRNMKVSMTMYTVFVRIRCTDIFFFPSAKF